MLSPRKGAPGRAHSGRLASRVAPGPVFHPDADDGAERIKIRAFKTALKLGILALVVFLLVSFFRYFRNGSITICASICSWRVSAYDEVSFAIELLWFAFAWTVCASGIWNHIGEADQVELFCIVFPLLICTYFIGFPALVMRSKIFYVQSQSMRNRICKSTLVSLLTAFVFCYGQEHEVVLQGKTYVEERMQGIAMMPLLIVLPIMPLVLTIYEGHHEKVEAQALRPRTLAITFP